MLAHMVRSLMLIFVVLIPPFLLALDGNSLNVRYSIQSETFQVDSQATRRKMKFNL